MESALSSPLLMPEAQGAPPVKIDGLGVFALHYGLGGLSRRLPGLLQKMTASSHILTARTPSSRWNERMKTCGSFAVTSAGNHCSTVLLPTSLSSEVIARSTAGGEGHSKGPDAHEHKGPNSHGHKGRDKARTSGRTATGTSTLGTEYVNAGPPYAERPCTLIPSYVSARWHGLTRLYRLIGLFHDGPGRRIKIGILQRSFKLALYIIFAAFNFLDDRLVILPGEGLLQIHECAMGCGKKVLSSAGLAA